MHGEVLIMHGELSIMQGILSKIGFDGGNGLKKRFEGHSFG
jgi:hypothetical protein